MSDISENTPDPLLGWVATLFDSPGRALDIACGTGRNATYLARSGWSVLGVDISEVALAKARERAESAGVDIETAAKDVESADYRIEPARWDLVCVCRFLHRPLFPEIRAGLRAGGIAMAIIAMVDDDPLIRPMNAKYLLRPGELRSYFEGLELLHYSEEKSAGKRRMAQMAARRSGNY